MNARLAAMSGLAATAASHTPAAAAAFGHVALALAALAGSYAPNLSAGDKAALARLFVDKAAGAPAHAKITVSAKSVVCRAGNVDIAAFACELMFGGKKVVLTGRRAHELLATLREAGAPAEGAAGTIYVALHAMRCTIDPDAIARKDGSGAACAFVPGVSQGE